MPPIRVEKDRISSPYLLAHADNPVDWYAWGDEPFARARELNRPVFISIGYAACHWCHVMAHESFEDEKTAALLNEHFVSVKVDREERPDVDAIYMESVQALAGQGGWPLSVFTTPDGRPFFGGTYFPKLRRGQIPSFTELVSAVAAGWEERREELIEQATELTEAVGSRLAPPRPEGDQRPRASELLARAVERFGALFDPEYGGINGAPKFPQATMLELLCHASLRGDVKARGYLERTLRGMATGGIYDHLGGGFSRYSVDRRWLIPHFEKMLYDQAMAVRLYLHGWQLTGEPDWLQVAAETIEYVLRDLSGPNGALFAAQDADSEGKEGLYYTWTREEVISAVGSSDAHAIFSWYGEMQTPNFEHGRSVLFRPTAATLLRPGEVEEARRHLFAARSERIPPATDDKAITEWNAMFASALAEAAGATGHPGWRDAAVAIGDFLSGPLLRKNGRLLRSFRHGRAAHLGMATDYAWTVDCLTRIYELTGRSSYLASASELANDMIELFSAEGGGWYLSGKDTTGLIVRPLDSYDGVTPAAGSIATSALSRLGAISGDRRFLDRARQSVEAATTGLTASPIAFSHLVQAALMLDEGALEIAIGPERPDLVRAAQSIYHPDAVLAFGDAGATPLLEGRTDPLAYVCTDGVCRLPVESREELLYEIEHARANR